MSLVSYYYTNQWSDHMWDTQNPCGVLINRVISKSLKKLKKSYYASNKLLKDAIQRQANALKSTYLEIQAITWRYDRGI